MIKLFLSLTLFNLLCLSITAALGYAVQRGGGAQWAQYHQLAGVLTAVACCAVHCVVFTYFIATAKWILHAIDVKRLDPALSRPTRSFRAQAFPAAILAMGVVIVTAVVGVITLGYGTRPIWHHALAWMSIAVNLVVAVVEYRAVVRNGRLIDVILDQIRQHDSTQQPAAGTA